MAKWKLQVRVGVLPRVEEHNPSPVLYHALKQASKSCDIRIIQYMHSVWV